MKFYGNNEETYASGSGDGKTYCIQSPDRPARQGNFIEVQEVPASAIELDIDALEFGLCSSCLDVDIVSQAEPNSDLCSACTMDQEN